MTDDEIKQVATEVLRAGQHAPHFVSAETDFDTDFDGTPIIRITATYDRYPSTFDSNPLGAMHDIRSELIARGEERVVFLRNRYLGDVDPEVEDAA